MNKKIKNFLSFSFVGLVAICIIAFTTLVLHMAGKTKMLISEISEIYMSQMNIQLQQKFTSIISLRLSQVEGIIKIIPPDTSEYNDETLDELKENIILRDFSYLGFLDEEGQLETVYGDKVKLKSSSEVLNSLNNDGTIVEQGINEDGDKFLLLGKRAAYPMESGKKSSALVVGISMEYLNQALFLYSDESKIYTHIIDSDGMFVIRNGSAYRDSYFRRVKDEFQTVDKTDIEQYIQELKDSMSRKKDYFSIMLVNGDKRYIYCSPISENSTWYLVTAMSSGVMGDNVTKLDKSRLMTMMVSILFVLFAMSFVFIRYYKMSQLQMKELNEAKQDADRANMAKTDFLSSMSHDIRTPMNAIIGMTEIALKNKNDVVRVEDCLRKVKLSSKHLLGLINDVLDMSKIESGKMVLNSNPMSLRETMDDIVNIVQPQIRERNQYFDIFIRDILSEDVYCDDVRLNQVLLNILSNALKFTPEKGRIDVHLYQEKSPLGDEYVRTHFIIEDTGIGMSEEFQKRIFNTFEREETEQVQSITGTGLGMSITKRIIDLMGGTIELQSEKGKGTRFHIILDLKKTEIKADDMKLPEWNVLVVDDNEQLCLSAVSNLNELGVHADWTLNGRKAVEMIEKQHKNNEDYHFVLIDWKMPDMDGLQTIKEIRKKVGKEIPVFLIFAYDWSDIENDVSISEIEGFISKPLFKSTLFTRLMPYAGEEKLSAEQSGAQEIDFTGRRILLAEDIDLNWEIAYEILSTVGLVLERAVDGQECVEMFEKSETGYYDAILMDIRMPRMNGYDATRTIRALSRQDKDLPIIAMTADAFSDDAQRCFECGMNAHLAKPLDIKECMRTLQKYLN